MQKRADLTNAIILAALKRNGNNVNKTSLQLNCSYRLVHDVLKGRRKDPGEWAQFPAPRVPVDDPCTCCGFREKMEGNRFLCEYCYKNEGQDMDELPLLLRVKGQPTHPNMLSGFVTD